MYVPDIKVHPNQTLVKVENNQKTEKIRFEFGKVYQNLAYCNLSLHKASITDKEKSLSFFYLIFMNFNNCWGYRTIT